MNVAVQEHQLQQITLKKLKAKQQKLAERQWRSVLALKEKEVAELSEAEAA